MIRPPEKAGAFRVSPGRLEKHEVENLGDIPSEFLRVELKRVPLGFQPDSFRNPKNFDTAHSGVSTEFECPYFSVRRIVAASRDATRIAAAAGPALLIAFTPALFDNSATKRTLKQGDVIWIEPGIPTTLRRTEARSADLLKIAFPGK